MEYCVCGCAKKAHFKLVDLIDATLSYCALCYRKVGEDKSTHDFKLDNLRFVEEKAKRRKLI